MRLRKRVEEEEDEERKWKIGSGWKRAYLKADPRSDFLG
jgi:hypothetical protein